MTLRGILKQLNPSMLMRCPGTAETHTVRWWLENSDAATLRLGHCLKVDIYRQEQLEIYCWGPATTLVEVRRSKYEEGAYRQEAPA